MNQIPEHTLRAIEQHFHDVIRERVAVLGEISVPLPEIPEVSGGEKSWFPYPGMYGGFSFWLEGEGETAMLISESWSRVAQGSGQRHEITAEGARLVATGFV